MLLPSTTMDAATEDNPNGKRQRTEDDAQLSPNASPLEKAKFSATIALASLPATIKSLAMEYHSKFLALRIEIQRLSKTKERLSQADFIPTSARIKFELTASARVKEKANDEFKALAERTQGAVEFYQNSIKIELKKLVDLELKQAKDALRLHFCKSVAALGITISIHNPDVEMAHSKDLIAFVFEHRHDVLLKHSEITTPQEFFDLLKQATNDPAPAHTFPSITNERGYAVEPAADTLKILCEAMFVRSWDTYTQAREDQVRLLTLKEFVDTTLKETVTAPVAMALDDITTDSPQLAEFVSDQVTKSTAKLRGQVAQLQKQLLNPTKNRTRGAKTSSAPRQNKNKKKDASKPKKTPNSPNEGRQAADAAKGSSTVRQRPGKNKQKKKKVSFARNGTRPAQK
jgi:hypothetical protein